MEGKKQPKQASSSSPPASTSSLVADLFGEECTESLFLELLPLRVSPASTVMGRDSWKQGAQGQTWNGQNVPADGAFHGSGNKEKSPAYQHEKIDPCSFSSSLYYGGQDICTNAPSSHSPGYNHKKDGEDDSNNPNAASRGNWWQGSLYY